MAVRTFKNHSIYKKVAYNSEYNEHSIYFWLSILFIWNNRMVGSIYFWLSRLFIWNNRIVGSLENENSHVSTPITRAWKHTSMPSRQARKQTSTQALKHTSTPSTQAREAREHTSTSSTQFSRLILISIIFLRQFLCLLSLCLWSVYIVIYVIKEM